MEETIHRVKHYFLKNFTADWQKRDGSVVCNCLSAVLLMNWLDIGILPFVRINTYFQTLRKDKL